MEHMGMYVATLLLFLLPACLLWVPWKDSLKNGRRFSPQDRRPHCQRAALVIGSLGAVAAMGFFSSWIHNGGSPHGLTPPSGLWQIFRPIAEILVVATVIAGAFGKGKGRLLLVGSAISICFVIYLLAALEMN